MYRWNHPPNRFGLLPRRRNRFVRRLWWNNGGGGFLRACCGCSIGRRRSSVRRRRRLWFRLRRRLRSSDRGLHSILLFLPSVVVQPDQLFQIRRKRHGAAYRTIPRSRAGHQMVHQVFHLSAPRKRADIKGVCRPGAVPHVQHHVFDAVADVPVLDRLVFPGTRGRVGHHDEQTAGVAGGELGSGVILPEAFVFGLLRGGHGWAVAVVTERPV